MIEIIAKGLKDQLRVLSIFLNEYETELNGKILCREDYLSLKVRVDNIKDYITNMYHV